jgi:hypothetical protein
MPRGDGTGPFGEGPGTGRNMKRCSGYSAPGFRNRFYATGVPFSAYSVAESAPQLGRNEEIELLKNETEHLRGKLVDIERRLGEIETT